MGVACAMGNAVPKEGNFVVNAARSAGRARQYPGLDAVYQPLYVLGGTQD